jgi:hypothetical protein
MRLFSNYLVILVLLVLWPALLLLFLVFSAWLDRYAAQPPKWVLRRQAAAQARAEALSAASEGPVNGRTRYWNPPRVRAGRDQRPAQASQANAVPGATVAQPRPQPQAPPQSWSPAPAIAGGSPGRGGLGMQPAPPARPGTARGRRTTVDENTEPMAGFPADRLPPDPGSAGYRHPPAGQPAPGADSPNGIPAGRRERNGR